MSSYLVLDRRDKQEVSYAAPVIAPFIGAGLGEERPVATKIEKDHLWRVVSIEAWT